MRHLRKSIQNLLEVIMVALMLFLIMLCDFELRFIPVIILFVLMIIGIFMILKKYGKEY